jgi:Ca2+-binding RTX toxin-like protein
VTLQSIEGVVGSPFGDTLTGDSASNDVLGFGGDDAMFGAGGFDYLRFDFASGVTADLSVGSATGEGDDTFTGFEAIVGSRSGDSLTGKRGANEIFGLQGSDEIAGLGGPDDLFGQGGADLLLGGGGNDDLFGGPGGDTCIQGPGTGLRRSC